MSGGTRLAAAVVLTLGALLTMLAYRPALDVGFVFDDISTVVEAPALHWHAVSIDGVKQVLSGARLPRRPVANLTFALNWAMGGADPAGFHLVNVLIHLAVGASLFWVALLYLRDLRMPDRDRDGRPLWAAIATVLFLVHPLNTQAVTYAVQRMSSLAALWCLVSFGAYLAGRRAASGRGATSWYALAALSWLLGVGSKENALALPLVILIWEWAFERSGWRVRLARWGGDRKRLALGTAATGVVTGVGGLLLLRFTRGVSLHLFDLIPGRDFTGLERVLTQARVQIDYLGLLLWPSSGRLNLDHDVAVSHGLLEPPTTLAAVVFWIAVAVAAVALARRRPLLGFPVLGYLALHLIEAGPLGLDLMFEHRMYLPMTMLALLGAAGLAVSAQRWRRVAIPVALLAAVPLGAATYARNLTWLDPLELHRDIAHKSPGKARAQHNLGVALLIAGRPHEATVPLERATQLDPGAALPWSQLGHAYLETGRPERAEAAFRRAFTLDPRDARSGFNVALALERQGRTAEAAEYLTQIGTTFGMRGSQVEAIRALRRAVELDPGSSTAHNQLGSAYLIAGRLADATAAYHEAVRLDPDNAEALYNLGLALEREGDLGGAIEAYQRFLLRAPPRLGTQIELVKRKLVEMESVERDR